VGTTTRSAVTEQLRPSAWSSEAEPRPARIPPPRGVGDTRRSDRLTHSAR
jgi:hypothetical protein